MAIVEIVVVAWVTSVDFVALTLVVVIVAVDNVSPKILTIFHCSFGIDWGPFGVNRTEVGVSPLSHPQVTPHSSSFHLFLSIIFCYQRILLPTVGLIPTSS